MPYDMELAGRIRKALALLPSVREVRMFGGLSFLVHDRLVVCATSDGNLLVRAAPERAGELLSLPGARVAEMGAHRKMGKGWIAVTRNATTAEGALDFWIRVALAVSGPH